MTERGDESRRRRLSWRIYHQVDPANYPDPVWDGTWEGCHPLVAEMVEAYGEGAVKAAAAYMRGDDTAHEDPFGVVRWMADGAFKGWFKDRKTFARIHFGDSLVEHLSTWHGHEDTGFLLFPELSTLEVGDLVNWEEVAGRTIDRAQTAFQAVPLDHGVYIFDQSIDIYEYLGLLPSPCKWFALCDRAAVMTLRHPILGQVPVCQRCADKDASLAGQVRSPDPQ